jgi:ATP synthase protein I
MGIDPESEKLDAMAARIRQAEGKPVATENRSDVKPMSISGVGFDFLGAVLVCGFLGWLADRMIGTKPWGLLIMLLVGFAVGITNVWRALGNKADKN